MEDVESACQDLLVELAPQFPDVSRFAVWLVEADGSRMRRVAALDSGGSGTEFEPFLPLGDGLDVDAVHRTGVSQAFNYPRSSRSRSGRAARKAGVASVLYVPLRSRNTVTGLLTFASKQPRAFGAEDQSFLETLAAQLGGQLDAIRERERTEAEWERLRTLIETLPVGIALLDASGRVVLWNEAVEKIWGHGPVDVSMDRMAQAYGLLTPEGRPVPDTPIARVLRGGEAEVGREFLIRNARNGSDRPVVIDAAPINDVAGRLTGVVTVYQDIGRLREVDRLKDDFISTVSHELRTPTTTVRGGALTLLRRGDQIEPEVRRQLLEDIAEEAERLYHLVEDLLVLSRVQAGMQLQTEPLIAHRFVNKVILDLGGRVGNHGLTVDVPEDLPLVDADPACLEQILRNLLENAVKFSPSGRRIEISAEQRGYTVMFSVLDRGSGIPAADMDRVFEPFYKTADAVRTGSQGAGLGLAVCRRLVQVQGGQIWAESRPGGGTAFRFTLQAILEESGE
jgi:PAS domain S-box-containing protein